MKAEGEPPPGGSRPAATHAPLSLRAGERGGRSGESGRSDVARRTARVAALVPALDVEATIAAVVSGALRHVERVLVVDDGSRDRTAELARAAGAEVVRHEQNRGKGAALRSGLVRLLAEGWTHAFTVDGDGQHLADEMPAMLRVARSHPGAIVLGARRIDPAHEVAPMRRFGNAFANWWVSLAAGRELGDTQSGFRIYPIASVLQLEPRGERYEFESEVLILAARRGMDVRAVEVAVHYPPPGELVSHYEPWLDTCRIIFTVVPFLIGLRR